MDHFGLTECQCGLKLELEKMRIVANRRAEASNSRWIEDVRSRKLCIANGSGTVHGVTYDIGEQYGLWLVKAVPDKKKSVRPRKAIRTRRRTV